MAAPDWSDVAAADLDTLWLLSSTEEANDRIASTLSGMADDVGRPLRIERAALGSPDPDRAKTPDTVQHGRLVAAVLVLEPEGIDEQRLAELGRWLAVQAMDDPGFRVFICLDGLTDERVRDLAQQGHPLLSELIDTIQFSGAASLREELSQHLRGVRAQRTVRTFQRLQLTLSLLVGRAALFVELACVAGVVVAAPLLLVPSMPWEALSPIVLSLVLGAAVFPLLSGPLYVVLHGARGLRLLEGRPANVWLLGIAAALSAVALHVSQVAGAGWGWISLGLVSGVLLEAARRSRRQARRQLVSPARIVRSATDVHTVFRLTRSAFSLPNPWGFPLLPLPGIDVFLSYAHASAWGREATHRVREALAAAGLKTFLDRRDISAGSAWQGTLAESIAETGVFVAALDPESMRRDWVAAEVTAALVGRATAALPQIVFLTDRDPQSFPPDERRHPVFSAVLERIEAGGPEAPPCRIVGDPAEAAGIPGPSLRGLVAHNALLPPLLVLPVLLAVLVVAVPGALSLPAGAAAWLLGILQLWDKYDSAAMLDAAGLLDAAYIACGFLLGFGARSRVVARMRERLPLFSLPMDFLALAGFLVAVVAWFPHVHALTAGWALAAFPCGLMAAELFFRRARETSR
ncbi:MAG: toll/interleukin-1 receptor domain-containing protein [Acidobacteriota bacterium]|nr:MAG: toll/interleukin-1 receptor domain-containing protein [Acidobacteriota bacterium]